MRILLDTSYALRGPSGTAVYLDRLREALDGVDVDVVAVGDRGRPAPAGGGLGSVRNLARDRWWRDVALPRLARRHRVDLIHHPLPARAARAGVPQVVTVHDLAFEVVPECFDRGFRRWASFAHGRATRSADAVVAVSETTAADVRERWGVGADRIVVAPHGAGQWRGERSVPVTGRPYLLYVGDDEPRKDLSTLRAAHRLLRASLVDAPPDLLLAGRFGSAPGGNADGGAAGGVRVVRDPDSGTLRGLMDGALALVHPALHEGVGLTLLEAMARGVPVVAARSAGVVETCAGAALYVPPGDPRVLAEALARVAGDPELRARLGAAGRQVASARSWSWSARRHVEAYTLALGRAPDTSRSRPPA